MEVRKKGNAWVRRLKACVAAESVFRLARTWQTAPCSLKTQGETRHCHAFHTPLLMDDTLTFLSLELNEDGHKTQSQVAESTGEVGSPQCARKEPGSLRSRSLCPSVCHVNNCIQHRHRQRHRHRRHTSPPKMKPPILEKAGCPFLLPKNKLALGHIF